jgi:hypothetical protein
MKRYVNTVVAESEAVLRNNPPWVQNIRQCRRCHEQGLLYNDEMRQGYPVMFESGNLKSKIVFILEAPNFADSFDPDKQRLTYDAETDPTGRFVRECLRDDVHPRVWTVKLGSDRGG